MIVRLNTKIKSFFLFYMLCIRLFKRDVSVRPDLQKCYLLHKNCGSFSSNFGLIKTAYPFVEWCFQNVHAYIQVHPHPCCIHWAFKCKRFLRFFQSSVVLKESCHIPWPQYPMFTLFFINIYCRHISFIINPFVPI